MQNEELDYSLGDVKPWKKIISIIIQKKFAVAMMLISIVLVTAGDLAFPLINQYAINKYIEGHDFYNVSFFISLYVGFALVYGVNTVIFLYFTNQIQIHTAYELRRQAFYKLQQLPFSYFDQTPQGWIMARVTSDSRKLSIILSWGLIDFLWGFLTMLGILIVMLVLNPLLSVIILATLPILIAFSFIIRKVILKHYRATRKINSEITAMYNEGFLGSKTIKSLAIEEDSKESFNQKALKYQRSAIRAAMFSALFGPVVFVLGYFGVAGTLLFGSHMILGGVLTVSSLYVFIDYTITFFNPVISISRVLGDFQQAQASAERIISLIDCEPEIKDSPEVIDKYGTIFNPKRENFEPLIGDVEFKDVSFKYNKGEMVLKDFNLKIPAGTNVALVGHTGSGKSTIVNLICRFYEPTSGEILIDGKNYKERSIGWLHENLGYVLQTPQLFSGSIKDNVKYGNLTASDDDVKKACELVYAREFIEELPDGYDSLVGEGGSKLSIGEKQLISFARALIADPKILILDEATSSIDTKTEALIQKAINVVLKGRTSFMIAHRLSTVVNADLILVMKDGKVIESGKHHDLLLKKGYYFELYKTQFAQEGK